MKAKHIMNETFWIQPDCRVILLEQVVSHTRSEEASCNPGNQS